MDLLLDHYLPVVVVVISCLSCIPVRIVKTLACIMRIRWFDTRICTGIVALDLVGHEQSEMAGFCHSAQQLRSSIVNPSVRLDLQYVNHAKRVMRECRERAVHLNWRQSSSSFLDEDFNLFHAEASHSKITVFFTVWASFKICSNVMGR